MRVFFLIVVSVLIAALGGLEVASSWAVSSVCPLPASVESALYYSR